MLEENLKILKIQFEEEEYDIDEFFSFELNEHQEGVMREEKAQFVVAINRENSLIDIRHIAGHRTKAIDLFNTLFINTTFQELVRKYEDIPRKRNYRFTRKTTDNIFIQVLQQINYRYYILSYEKCLFRIENRLISKISPMYIGDLLEAMLYTEEVDTSLINLNKSDIEFKMEKNSGYIKYELFKEDELKEKHFAKKVSQILLCFKINIKSNNTLNYYNFQINYFTKISCFFLLFC